MVEHVSRIFGRPPFVCPVGLGVGCLNLVIFGFCQSLDALVLGVGVWFVFGWVWAFHGLFLLKLFLWRV